MEKAVSQFICGQLVGFGAGLKALTLVTECFSRKTYLNEGFR